MSVTPVWKSRYTYGQGTSVDGPRRIPHPRKLPGLSAECPRTGTFSTHIQKHVSACVFVCMKSCFVYNSIRSTSLYKNVHFNVKYKSGKIKKGLF